MKRIQIGQGFIVFIIFFGIAVLDAIRSFDWLRTIFWIGVGSLFILADNMKKGGKENN
jgi:hypothetical protein